MFWRFGGYANVSTLDTILDKPDVTVEELLEESDLIQELKQQNSKLIEYLRDENVLDRLLRYVIAPKHAASADDDGSSRGGLYRESSGKSGRVEGFFGKRDKSRSKSISRPDEEDSAEEKQRKKYAFVACEILSSEVWSISEALIENHQSLRSFWQFLKRLSPLDPVQAGYFNKINESLLDRKTEEMLEFFKSTPDVVSDMLSHVDCPPIMDLLLKVISLEKSEGGQGIVDWLQSQNLIPQLLSFLTPEYCSATQTSAGDFLKAIITISANATTQDQSVIGPNELTRQLVSEECIKKLISDMLRGGNPLTVGVGIVIEVIRKNNSDYDLESQIGPAPRSTDPIYLGTLLRQFAVNVVNFMDLILLSDRSTTGGEGTVSKKRELKAAFGGTIEPLGFDRFKTCELMAELLHCSNMALLNERGSDSDVKRRDAERERLKAEGKLLPAKDNQPTNEFSTSVDSQGFHHAKPPSNISDSPEEIRRLEVQNNGEEDYEKVAASDEEEAKDDFDEKTDFDMEQLDSPSNNRSPGQEPEGRHSAVSQDHEGSNTTADNHGSSSPSIQDPTLSPTSAGITARVGGLDIDLDNPTPQSDSATQPQGAASASSPPSSKHHVSLLTQQLRAEEELSVQSDLDRGVSSPEHMSPSVEKPAPLFSGKSASSQEGGQLPQSPTPPAKGAMEGEDAGDPARADGGEETPHSMLLTAHEGDFGAPFEVDLDGSPVVGDLLKMMFVEHRVVPTILDFFFRFPWNNFLHNVVYDVVQQVFNGQMDRGFNRNLAIDLFETGRVTERIIQGQQMSDKAQKETNMRLGYMGHLTLIAEEVVKFTERHPPELLSQVVAESLMHQAWIDYVEHTLAETRERDNAILGGVRPDLSVGPRQAVLNAVNAGQSFNGASGGLLGAGLSGNGAIGLDSIELASGGNTTSGYVFGGGGTGALLSGFTNSSDEEDEDMEEMEGEKQGHQAGGQDQPASTASVPPPLNIPPSRARRQFALRLAQRKLAEDRASAAGENPSDEVADLADGSTLTATSIGTITITHAPTGASRLGDQFLSPDEDKELDDIIVDDDDDVEDDDEDEEEEDDDDDDEHESSRTNPRSRGLELDLHRNTAPSSSTPSLSRVKSSDDLELELGSNSSRNAAAARQARRSLDQLPAGRGRFDQLFGAAGDSSDDADEDEDEEREGEDEDEAAEIGERRAR